MRLGFVLAAALAGPVFAQVQGPPPVLQIIRETVKEGKGAAHERTEAEYVQAFRKAKSTGYYLGLAAVSGTSEVWFLAGYPSFAAVEKIRQESRVEPLKSEMAAAEEHDGALRESSRTVWAVYRADLSYQAEKLNVGKARYLTVGTYQVRLGHEAGFMADAKVILGGYEKANMDEVMLCYQVIAGEPAGTYLFFTPMESLKRMDELPARQAALRQAMGADAFQKLTQGAGETYALSESRLFEVSPGMSYVSQQTIDADPAYWVVKATVKPAPKSAPAKRKR